jgi:PTH1 family peptidyl-tRNA hydrolase
LGLGNPGTEYVQTRHNVGFWALDRISECHRIPLNQDRHFGLTGAGSIRGWKVLLVKPMTYMNLSGKAAKSLLAAEGLGTGGLIVLHDDMDIALGRVKLKISGGAAGHHGVESIIRSLGTEKFHRFRIGIGRPPEEADSTEWLLSPFLEEELEAIQNAVSIAADKVVELIEGNKMSS